MIVRLPNNPIVVFGANADEIKPFIGEPVDVDGDKLTVKSSDGNFYRCKPDMFKPAYERLTSEDAT